MSIESTPGAQQTLTIVGAGIVGLASALALQRAGFKVRVLDKTGVAAGASKGNAGHFGTEQVFPLADPALLLKLPGMLLDPLGPFRIRPQYFFKALPWFMRFLLNMSPARRAHNTQAIRALNQKAIGAMQQLVNFCDCESLLILNGSLLVFETTPRAEVEAEYRRYAAAGVAVRLLDGDAVRALEPTLSPTIRHGLYFTQVGHTPDPQGLCEAMAQKFVSQGGELVIGELAQIQTQGGLSLRTTEGNVWQTEHLLLAAGAWSTPFARQIGHKVPLETERGYHLMMPQFSGLSRPVASFERKFIITPMAQGTRLAGTVEFGGLKAPMSPARADCLFEHARILLPQIFATAKVTDGERWMGFRPSLPDSLPVIGKSNVDRVYFSFGHQHLGLTWAAISANLLEQIILGKQPEIDMAPYRVQRFD